MAPALARVGTYLPPFGGGTRTCGPDEDAVTLAVAAGLAAFGPETPAVATVVFVSRDFPVLEGGNGQALLRGLGLPDDVDVVERLGGAAAMLDAAAGAHAGTLVIGADRSPAGAAALLVMDAGAPLSDLRRVGRSLPLHVRDAGGAVHDYDDPRLARERGVHESVTRLGLDAKPAAVAGVPRTQAAAFCAGDPPELPTAGASSTGFALGWLAEQRVAGLVAAVDQGQASSLAVGTGPVDVHRDEPTPRDLPPGRFTPGPEMTISLAAFDRAYEPKLRWEAGRCRRCGTLHLPPRLRCTACGSEEASDPVPLPRRGTVYTSAEVHVPVPGKTVPYTLAVVELDGVDVRALVHVAGRARTAIGERGTLVFRLVATRSGVPDYGYAFVPEVRS